MSMVKTTTYKKDKKAFISAMHCFFATSCEHCDSLEAVDRERTLDEILKRAKLKLVPADTVCTRPPPPPPPKECWCKAGGPHSETCYMFNPKKPGAVRPLLP